MLIHLSTDGLNMVTMTRVKSQLIMTVPRQHGGISGLIPTNGRNGKKGRSREERKFIKFMNEMAYLFMICSVILIEGGYVIWIGYWSG